MEDSSKAYRLACKLTQGDQEKGKAEIRYVRFNENGYGCRLYVVPQNFRKEDLALSVSEDSPELTVEEVLKIWEKRHLILSLE